MQKNELYGAKNDAYEHDDGVNGFYKKPQRTTTHRTHHTTIFKHIARSPWWNFNFQKIDVG